MFRPTLEGVRPCARALGAPSLRPIFLENIEEQDVLARLIGLAANYTLRSERLIEIVFSQLDHCR